MRRSVKKTMLWGSLGLLFLIGVAIILPWFLNPDYLQSLVLRHIQQTLGPHVQVGRTSLAIFPSPHFLVSDIVLKEQADSHAVFRAQSMSLKLGIGQLLQKKILVKEFVLHQPEIEVHRDTSGTWRFLGRSHEDSSLPFLSSFLVLGKIEVTNGKIIMIDESPSDSVRGVVLENVAWVSETSYKEANVFSNLTLSGNLKQSQDFASFQLSGTVDATSNAPLSPLAGVPVFFKHILFTGKLKTHNLAVNQLTEYGSYGDVLAQFPGRLNVDSQITWVKKETTSQLNLSNMALTSPSLTLAGSVTIEGLEDGHHMTLVSLRSSSLNMEMIQKSIPKTWLAGSLAALWDQAQWGGELQVLDARVRSSTRADVDLSLTGTFQVKNGFFHSVDWPRTERVQGTVVVEPDRIYVSDTNGVYDQIPVQVTKGVLLLKETGAWGDVEIEGQVPAEKVWNFIRNLATPSSRPSAWKDVDVSEGQGLLRLRFSGEVFDEKGLTFHDGDYQPTNVVFHIPDLPHALSNAQGKIQFSPDSTVFEDITGEMGAYPFTLQGTLIHQDGLRIEPLHVTAGFDGSDFFRSFKQPSSEFGIQITGPLHTEVTMRGPIDRLNFRGKINSGRARVLISSVLQKEANQAGVLEFDGQFQSGGIVRFERIELAMLPIRLRGQGIARFHPTWGWEGRLDSGPISMEGLPENIQMFGNVIQSGTMEVQLGGKGIGKDWTKWRMKGWVALTDGVVRAPGIPEVIDEVFVRLRIDKDLLDLKRMEFHIKDSEAVVTGFVENWNTTPTVSVLWNAKKFDIDLLIPKDERSVLRDGVEWLASHGKLEGSIFVEHPRYKELSGNKLSAVLNVHDNLVSIEKIQTMVEKHGNAKGRVFVHLPPGKPAAVRGSFEGNNLPFEKTLMVLGDDRRLISGQLDIRGKIQGHGRDTRGIIPTLEGEIELSLRNGYVRKGTVLPKILRILNLPHLLRGKVNLEKTGFPYESIAATLMIQEGIFATQDFLLRSPVMKATAASTYDFHRDHLDGAVAVSPFGAYSEVLKAIPLFGTIFSGERKGIATAMFNLSGPLKDPQVVYLPKESLKNGMSGLAQLAFDVLKNTVLIPVRALNGSSKDTTSSPAESEHVPPKDIKNPVVKEESRTQ